MRLFGYVRVSSKSQEDNTSLVDQESRIRAYCQALGHELVEVFVEVGSAKTMSGRREFQIMLGRLDEVDGVISLKLDRLSRSVKDLLSLVDDVLIPQNKALMVLDMQLDTSSPAGRMVLTVLAAMCQMERELIQARTKAGRDAKAAAGGYCGGGQRAFGRKWNREAEQFEAIPDEQQAIQRMAELKDAGLTQVEIAEELNKQGIKTAAGRKWSQMKVSQVMAREFPKPKRQFQSRIGRNSGLKAVCPNIDELVISLHHDGLKQRAIAAELEKQGIRSKRNKPVTQSTISRILSKAAVKAQS